MIFSDTEMMELDIRHTTNIHNTRSLIRTLKYVLDILQTEEAFTVKEYKHTRKRSIFNLNFLIDYDDRQLHWTFQTIYA